ncbi:HAF repeat-containing protein [Solimicrobium silvestre]|uniref:Putative extracellular repeat, HAF family n=1 Tax=Solimicrobium silvestre TaxID=2099400 RepID=A0A2S9H3X3_9BURK|nr:HAF repeat-containing protein [Solimicrobium silvestre]PRC94679.1 putative extracellular repeat, HAF family [Solimicrobium silvestre]
MHRNLQSCIFLLVLFGGEAAATTTTHSLGIVPPAKGGSIAYDMNAAGQVAAVIQDESGGQRGVFFENGKLIELGTLGGKDSEAKRINDKGEIIGSASKKDGAWSAVLYNQASGMHELGTLGGTNSYGTALNNEGSAVGFSDIASGDWHAFLYKNGEQLKDLGTLGGKISYASGINNMGQVVGTATLPDEHRHAFFYEPARGMIDLGTLGGRSSSATAINDKGVIVGASETADHHWHAFVYDGQRMVDLGAIIGRGDSFATSINSAGHVVGTVRIGEDCMSFVWRDNKVTLHYCGKGLFLTNAINDTEQVVGATYDHGLNAATMLSNTAPFVDHGHVKFINQIVLVLLLAGAAVIYRKRYRGILLDGSADLGVGKNRFLPR